MKNDSPFKMLVFLVVAFAFIALSGCDDAGEAIDNLDSRIQCGNYCDKASDCAGSGGTGESRDVCVSDCRQSIENNCGNDNQDAANEKIDECVDKNCAGFLTCMVFEAAPECFGFVTP